MLLILFICYKLTGELLRVRK